VAELRVGLIDSGVAADNPGRVSASRAFRAGADDAVGAAEASPDQLGHGTALAQILLAAEPGCVLLNAQVFSDRLSCGAAQVAAALDWLVQQGARLVNMSFGLREDRAVLRSACERAQAAGVVLVAASPARGEPVFPASYAGVIRATGDARCTPGQISWLDTVQADFGGHVRAPGSAVAGASVGCANVSAAALQIIAKNPEVTISALRAGLAARAAYRGPERRVC
jgi:hypothetical protein